MIQKQNPYQKNSQNSSTNTAWEVNNSRVYSHFTNQRLTQFDPLCLKLRFFFFFFFTNLQALVRPPTARKVLLCLSFQQFVMGI